MTHSPLTVEFYEDGLILRWLRPDGLSDPGSRHLYERFTVGDDVGTEYKVVAGSECFGRGGSHVTPAAPEDARQLTVATGDRIIDLYF